jgi:hypothetical protein
MALDNGSPAALLEGRLFVLHVPGGDDRVLLLDREERMVMPVWPSRALLHAWGVELDGRQVNFGPTLHQFGGGEAAGTDDRFDAEAQRCGVDAVWLIGSIEGPSA